MSKIVNHNYSQRTEPASGFKTLEEFYPFYLGEHCNQTNRRLHITGTTLSQIIIAYALIRQKYKWIIGAVVQGYAWAWIGHFIFEKNAAPKSTADM
ncbi:hypothetical protein NQZ79_g7754 [Umbelopsis isabellina]|nr:hypothetical protein NQZ79_g7754 [Umbelopsis isabellina]